MTSIRYIYMCIKTELIRHNDCEALYFIKSLTRTSCLVNYIVMTVPRFVITRSFFVIMRQFKLVFTWSFLVIMRKLTLNYKTNDLCSMTLFVFRNKNKQKPTYICKNCFLNLTVTGVYLASTIFHWSNWKDFDHSLEIREKRENS